MESMIWNGETLVLFAMTVFEAGAVRKCLLRDLINSDLINRAYLSSTDDKPRGHFHVQKLFHMNILRRGSNTLIFSVN